MARTHYDVLGVSSTADAKTIRQAYLRLSLKHHPDKNPENPDKAKAEFIEIGQAYEVLSNPQTRAEYDRNLAAGRYNGSGRADFASSFGGGRTSTSTSTSSYGNGTTSSAYPSNYGNQSTDDAFKSYKDAFDAHVSSMSEEDLRAAMGTAAVVGSLVGAVLGAKLASGSSGARGNPARGILANVGSVVGSMMASQAAQSMVKNVHEQSVQRVEYKEKCRIAQQRGEPMPPPLQQNSGIFDALSKVATVVVDMAQQAREQQQQQQQQNYYAGRPSGGPSYNTHRF